MAVKNIFLSSQFIIFNHNFVFFVLQIHIVLEVFDFYFYILLF